MHLLELQLATPLLAMQEAFYSQLLELPIGERTAESLSLQVGTSRLTFHSSEQPLPGVYHFAFNIPHNQFEAACGWIKQRVPLLSDAQGQTTFYSQSWDAHMLYFADPSGNIVELIARHSLLNHVEERFGASSLLNISEIGIAADDVPAQAADLVARTGSSVYQGPGSPSFTAIGDEHGLVIVVQCGRIWFPDTGKPAVPLPLSLVVQHQLQPLTLQLEYTD